MKFSGFIFTTLGAAASTFAFALPDPTTASTTTFPITPRAKTPASTPAPASHCQTTLTLPPSFTPYYDITTYITTTIMTHSHDCQGCDLVLEKHIYIPTFDGMPSAEVLGVFVEMLATRWFDVCRTGMTKPPETKTVQDESMWYLSTWDGKDLLAGEDNGG